MNRKALIAGAVLALAFPAAAPGQAPEAVDEDEKIVCKAQPVPNSRFQRKDCRTAKEWRRTKEMFRASIEKKQRDSLQNTCIFTGSGKAC